MTAKLDEEIKVSSTETNSVRTGISNFSSNRFNKAATEWTGGGTKIISKENTTKSNEYLFDLGLESRFYSLYDFYSTCIYPEIKDVRGSTKLKEYLENKVAKKRAGGRCSFSACGKDIVLSGQDSLNPIRQESSFVKFLMNNREEIENFVDVGGYTGFYSIFVSEVCDAHVTCFEADDENIDLIRKNKNLNSVDIDFVEKPVWSSEKELSFRDKGNGLSSVSSEGESKKSVALDDFFLSEKIDVLKIDVEGAELKVLEGAERILVEHQPVLLLELHKGSRIDEYNHEPIDVKEYLQAKGYQLEKVLKGDYDDLLICRPRRETI